MTDGIGGPSDSVVREGRFFERLTTRDIYFNLDKNNLQL